MGNGCTRLPVYAQVPCEKTVDYRKDNPIPRRDYRFGATNLYHGERCLYNDYFNSHGIDISFPLSSSVLMKCPNIASLPKCPITKEPYGLKGIYGPEITYERAAEIQWALDNDFQDQSDFFDSIVEALAHGLASAGRLDPFLNTYDNRVYSASLFYYADSMAKYALQLIKYYPTGLSGQRDFGGRVVWKPVAWDFYIYNSCSPIFKPMPEVKRVLKITSR